jgi:hypothetical protein
MTTKLPMTVKGTETIVIIDPTKGPPAEIELTHRLTLSDMEKQFHGMQVFARNKNLQALHSRGAILWLPYRKVIAVLIKDIGPKGYVKQLYPPQKDKDGFEIDMDEKGMYLEQLFGTPIVEKYKQEVQPKAIDPSTGLVIPNVDGHGNVKMSVAGPDVAFLPPEEVVPKSVYQDWQKCKPWTVLQNDSVEVSPQNANISDKIAVLYVYTPDEVKNYKECLVGPPKTTKRNHANTKQEKEALTSVPLGPIIKGDSTR